MLNLYLVVVLSLFISYIDMIDVISDNIKEFGPYKIDFGGVEICRGPKSKDLANFSMQMRNDNNEYKGTMNLNLPAVAILDEVKVTIFTTKEKRKHLLWSYKVDKPCQHVLVANIIAQFINNTSCVIKKGSYLVELNFTELSHTFFGTSFFYGTYTYKSLVLSKKGNIMCFILQTTISKK